MEKRAEGFKLQFTLLHQVHDACDEDKKERGVSKDKERRMNGKQPRSISVRHRAGRRSRVARHAGDESQDSYERQSKTSESLCAVAKNNQPVSRNQRPGQKRERFAQAKERVASLYGPIRNKRERVQYEAEGDRPKRNTLQRAPLVDERQNRMNRSNHVSRQNY